MSNTIIPPGIVAFKDLLHGGIHKTDNPKPYLEGHDYQIWTISVDGTQWSVGDGFYYFPKYIHTIKAFEYSKGYWYITTEDNSVFTVNSDITKLPVKDSGGEEKPKMFETSGYLAALKDIHEPNQSPSEPEENKCGQRATQDPILNKELQASKYKPMFVTEGNHYLVPCDLVDEWQTGDSIKQLIHDIQKCNKTFYQI